MRAFTLFSAFVAAAVSGVLATPGTSSAALIARQTTAIPEIPNECKAACSAIQSISTCAADLSCMCSNTIGQGIADCGTCGINYNKNDPNIKEYKAQFQASLNNFVTGCAQAGFTVGPFSVLGGSTSGGSPAAGSPSGSSSSPAASQAANAAASSHITTGAGAIAGLAVVMALVI